jgi:hypothetical protein
LALLDKAARLAPGVDTGALEAEGEQRRLAEGEECQVARKTQTPSIYKAFSQRATGRTTRSITRRRGANSLHTPQHYWREFSLSDNHNYSQLNRKRTT